MKLFKNLSIFLVIAAIFLVLGIKSFNFFKGYRNVNKCYGSEILSFHIKNYRQPLFSLVGYYDYVITFYPDISFYIRFYNQKELEQFFNKHKTPEIECIKRDKNNE